MSWNLARKTLGDRWRSTLFYGIGLVAYTLMMTAIFPTFKNMPNVDEFLKNYPEDLLRFFGSTEFDITNFNNYISMEFLGLMIVIVIGAYVFTFARSVTAGELKDGTLELLVTQPVERWEVVTSKSAVMLGGIAALVLSVVLAVFAFGTMFRVGVAYRGFAAYIVLAVALFLCIGGYSVLVTIVLPRAGTLAAVGLTVAFYVVNFAGETVSSISAVRYASVFHYYNPGGVLARGAVPWVDVLVLAGVGLACLGGAAYLFQHRDLIL